MGLPYHEHTFPTAAEADIRAGTDDTTAMSPLGFKPIYDELRGDIDAFVASRAESFGAVADGVLDADGEYVSGTDNLGSINELIAYMAANNVDGYLSAGVYYCSAEVVNNSGQILRGAGMYSTTLHCKISADDEVAFLIPPGASGSGIADMTVSIEPTVSKASNNGQYHAAIGVGGTYYFSVAPDPVTDFTIENVRLHRADNGISSGHAICLIGYITGGRIHNVTGTDSQKLHSSMCTAHWAGLGGPYGSTVTETYHVGGVTFSRFNGEGGLFSLVWSSTYDMKVIGSVGAKGCTCAFQWLPGDEGNRLAIAAQADRVGKGNHIDDIDISGVASDSGEIIGIFGNGTVPTWATFPAPDTGVVLQTQYYSQMTIGSITGRIATPQVRELMDVSKWYGNLHIGVIDIGDSVTEAVVDLNFCEGVTIDYIEAKGTFVANMLTVSESRGVKIRGRLENTDFSTTNLRGFMCASSTTSATLSADAAQGDQVIFVTGSIGLDTVINTPIYVNGHLVRTTAYIEGACTRIPITPLPAAVTTGQTVSVPNVNEIDVELDIYGAYTGAELETCRGRFAGSVNGWGHIGIRCDTNSRMTYDQVKFRGGGLGRIASGSLTTRDIFVAPSAKATFIAPTLGIDSEFIEYNLEVNSAGDAAVLDRRLLIVDGEFAGSGVSGYVTGSGGETDYLLVDCYTTAGLQVVGAKLGTQAAQPASGSVTITEQSVNYPYFSMTFTFAAARVTVTDAGGSGSSGSLKIFDFKESVIQMLGSRHNWTAFAEGAALTGGAGDASFVIGFGSAAADAADGALTGTEVDFGATRSITLSGGTGTGATTVTGVQTPLDGTSTATDLYLNWSGTAATIDANSTIDVTGTYTINGMLIGDD